MPTISVIVPVYKVEPYLRRCVDSILAQSYGDFDLILVDDGSPDACPCICDEYEDRDPRVHVIHQTNGGLSAARNSGIQWSNENSDSAWFCFIDSDDWVHRDYLQILLHAAQKENAGIAACGYTRIDHFQEDEVLGDIPVTGLDAQQAYCEHYEMLMSAWCKLFQKSLFETIRFPVGKLHEDAYISHILAFNAGRIAVVDLPLYYYYFNQQSITRAKWSPRRLDEIEAHEQRLPYLSSRGYQEAYRRELEVYIMTVYEHTEVLAGLARKHPKCREYLRILRGKLRSAMKAGRSLGLYPRNREYLWIHLMAGHSLPLWRGLKVLQKWKHKTA